MAYLIGTDIGTSSVKTIVFSEDGVTLSTVSKEYTFDVPKIGYAEQDPEVWWKCAVQTISEAIDRAGINAKDIKGVGLSGQMHGLVALDKENNVIRKSILHCDVRSTEQVDEIRASFGDEFSNITYNPIFPGFQLISLLWLRQNEPWNYDKTVKVICSKDYIRYKLTGEIGAEATDASGTLAYDMERQTWSEQILDKLNVDRNLFPECEHSSCDIAGTVTKATAKETGLKAGTPVVYGGGDQAMHSLGNGVYRKGIMTATIGTSGQVLCISDRPVTNPKLNTHTMRHVNHDTWYGLGATLNAGVTLNWFRRNFTENCDFDRLVIEAETAPPCCDGLVFFPCMVGERTPYMDASTRGMFLGISLAHNRGHMARAIMEGVAFAMKESLDILTELYSEPQKTICAGGGAKSRLWLQIQADIYEREVYMSETSEQACAGAAIVAGVGCGLYSNLEESCERLVRINPMPIEPITENSKKYKEFYQTIYSQLYLRNHTLFGALKRF